jgi:hypothetical protein
MIALISLVSKMRLLLNFCMLVVFNIEVSRNALPDILWILDVLLQIDYQLLQHQITLLSIEKDYWYSILEVAWVWLYFVIDNNDVTERPIAKEYG